LTTSVVFVVVVMMVESATELRLLTLAAASDHQQQQQLRPLQDVVGQNTTHLPAAAYGYSVLIISYHKTGVSSKCVFFHTVSFLVVGLWSISLLGSSLFLVC
jgi:hypothetical protein